MLLRLYVAGQAPNSVAAQHTLESALARAEREDVALEIVDVFEAPSQAAADGVLVTPTLLRLQPEPRMTIVGNLGDGERLHQWLALAPKGRAS